ncbi:hypothetical protein PM082_019846 [Marasmius tenuissimus]|nr:hypothetical protein PM082_019846 [Marasmius tenuissimus]
MPVGVLEVWEEEEFVLRRCTDRLRSFGDNVAASPKRTIVFGEDFEGTPKIRSQQQLSQLGLALHQWHTKSVDGSIHAKKGLSDAEEALYTICSDGVPS